MEENKNWYCLKVLYRPDDTSILEGKDGIRNAFVRAWERIHGRMPTLESYGYNADKS